MTAFLHLKELNHSYHCSVRFSSNTPVCFIPYSTVPGTLLVTYLYPELVEEVVYEVFGAADDAVIQVLTSNFMENSSKRRRRELVA